MNPHKSLLNLALFLHLMRSLLASERPQTRQNGSKTASEQRENEEIQGGLQHHESLTDQAKHLEVLWSQEVIHGSNVPLTHCQQSDHKLWCFADEEH